MSIQNQHIESVDQLIVYLTRLAAAYRKSYKFYGRLNCALQISSGIMGCSAALAVVPAIPIFIAISGALPSVITIFINKLKVEDKKNILKLHHQRIKQLITEAKIGKVSKEDDKKVIENILNRLLEMQSEKTYSMPLEMHMKEFKLNGYRDKPLRSDYISFKETEV